MPRPFEDALGDILTKDRGRREQESPGMAQTTGKVGKLEGDGEGRREGRRGSSLQGALTRCCPGWWEAQVQAAGQT